jgi:polyisoprenoid-binding protein YceI
MTEAATTTTTWTIDPDHSTLEFAVRHMMVTTVKGRFEAFSGTIAHDEADLEHASVAVTIATSSIHTGTAERDAHLRSADFLDCDRFPDATFRSTGIEPKGDGAFAVRGDLTIRDVTKPVVLDVAFQGTGAMPGGPEVAGFTATTSFARSEFGLTWNVGLECGGVLVSDEVRLSLDIQAGKA